jgi:hypothetical protein
VIDKYAFLECFLLKSICIPVGVCEIPGLAIASSGIESVTVEAQNPVLRLTGSRTGKLPAPVFCE